MSIFRVKAIVRRDIASQDCWFESSNDICEYLSSQRDSRMDYTNLDPESIGKERKNKEGHKIKGCMSHYIFWICTKFYNSL